MNKITINILFPGLLVLCGVFFFLGGIFISSFPVPVIYLGYLGFIAGLFWAICLLVPRPKWTFRIFILCWAVGACVTTFFIIPISIVAMLSTAVVHLPLLALTCHVANQKGKTRYSISIFYALSFIFALFLPHYTMIQFEKPYPQNPEQIKISADLLEDKNPPYIDEDSMWRQDTLEHSFFRRTITSRINKSAAVVALDLGELEDKEKSLTKTLFPTYQKALAYAKGQDLPLIPSVQLIDHKAKVFADRFYAALETYLQNHALALEGGKQAFLQHLLQELIQSNDDSPAHPFTRDEFRNLCDKYQNKDKIIHAIENKMILSAYGRIIIAGVIILLILIVIALFYITRFGARPNKFFSRSGGSF